MIEPAGIYTMAQVAGLLQHSPRWFRANRGRLTREGFPPPVSRVGRPRWLGASLIAWLERPQGVVVVNAGNVVRLDLRAREVAQKRVHESGSRR